MFVHLHCHSRYSFLRAVASPEEIAAAAAGDARADAAGQDAALPASLRGGAVALTDTNGLYAAVPFYQQAREAGVKPIVGVALDVALEEAQENANWKMETGEAEHGADGGSRGDPDAWLAHPSRHNWIAALRRGAADHVPAGDDESPLAGGDARDPAAAAEFSAPDSPSARAGGKLDAHVTWRGPRLVLLAENREGYANFCRLVTRRHLGGAPVGLATLAAHHAGVVALYAPPAQPRAAHEHEARRIAALKNIFGSRLYLEAHAFRAAGARRAASGSGGNLRHAAQLSRRIEVPLVATNNVHFLRPEEHLHHRVLNAIRTGSLLTKVAPPEIASPEAYFKSPAEMARAFADFPEALRATLEIAERCNLSLELGKTVFPECTVPAGETPFSFLWKLCFEGARRRYLPLRPEVLARLTHELEVIEKLHLAPYFLLVWEITEEARRRKIPAVARGSAASSMVTYCLGISRVCPLRWGLYFERFLNEERGDVPDIDLDICGARRDELLDWVYRRWGAGRVAMIGSFITMHARMAVREVAKVFGLSPGEVNRFTRRLPHRPVRDILEALRTLPECHALPAREEPWKTIFDLALRLDGFPRHLGIHPCGTVIAPRPLNEFLPLEVAAKGIVVTQPDMNAVESLGLVKMDLLGQRGLTTMSLALDNIRRSSSQPAPDFDSIPEHDPATCAMLERGRTLGVFQIESPGLRGLLRAQRARTLEDLCLAIAIIRPGAAEYGSKEAYLKRLRGAEPVRYPHARLEPILRDTLGVCVYQEQVMQIAQSAGGLSLAEADLVRRAQAKWADDRERQRLRGKFLKTAERIGLTGPQREAAWQMVEKFAGFGFCKAHAATYADLAYRMAYLKAHWPAEFLAAMCSAGAGFYHVSAYVEEAKRWGIEALPPCVNRSQFEYATESRSDAATALRIGLMQIKGLRLETIRALLRSRQECGPFRSLADFLARVPAGRDELESLVKCGAFDGVEPARTRPALLWQLNLLASAGPAPEAAPPLLFADSPAPPPLDLPALENYSREQRLALEQAILEVCSSGHPLDLIERKGEAWSTDVERLIGRRVTLLGWLVTFRHVGTKTFRNMMFATFEDQRGLFEVVLFPDAYQRYGRWVYEARMLRVTGRVQHDGHVDCERLEPARV